MLQDKLDTVPADEVIPTLRAALEEIAAMAESVVNEEDIIDMGWIVQIARVALAVTREETP